MSTDVEGLHLPPLLISHHLETRLRAETMCFHALAAVSRGQASLQRQRSAALERSVQCSRLVVDTPQGFAGVLAVLAACNSGEKSEPGDSDPSEHAALISAKRRGRFAG